MLRLTALAALAFQQPPGPSRPATDGDLQGQRQTGWSCHWRERRGLPTKRLRRPGDAPVSGETASHFKDLAPGRYAIKAFHDVNGDGKMATNPFGMPTEPFAFSNNAHGNMGPAKWADAAFEVKAGANTQTIDID